MTATCQGTLKPARGLSTVNLLFDTPRNPLVDVAVVLAHGAGAGMDSDFMVAMAQGLCAQGIAVVRFEFPYMAQRREGGSRRPPDKMPVLEETFSALLQQFGPRCVAAGKSMGGRVASHLLARQECLAAMSLGYPFHPPGKADQVRMAHWPQILRPWLIVQGSRDPFGTQEEVSSYALPPSARVRWLADGDHDFKPRKASGFSQSAHWQSAVLAMAEFVKEL